jgi:hypothetical protein
MLAALQKYYLYNLTSTLLFFHPVALVLAAGLLLP